MGLASSLSLLSETTGWKPIPRVNYELPLALRGEVWLVDLDPTRGREQAGKRPVLVVSANGFNKSPADLLVILPITSKDKAIPWHVALQPPEGGTKTKSFIMCEAVRSISHDRLVKRWGAVTPATLDEVEDRLRILFDL